MEFGLSGFVSLFSDFRPAALWNNYFCTYVFSISPNGKHLQEGGSLVSADGCACDQEEADFFYTRLLILCSLSDQWLMGECLGLTFRRIMALAAFGNRRICVPFRQGAGMQDLNLICGSFTDFVNLDMLLNIHVLNFSFVQQRENGYIFCPLPVILFFFFVVVGGSVLLLACMDGIKHHRLLFLVGLTAPVIYVVRKNTLYHRDTETSGV